MRVNVRVRETTIPIDVGEGSQRLKWLSMVALQRYEADAALSSDGDIYSQVHVATGLMDAEGSLLPPNKSIRVALTDGQEVFALLQADDDPASAEGKRAKGTSLFLMSQGAAPSKCVIGGPGVTYAREGQPAVFTIVARDTYGNLARNGGEQFDVRVAWQDPGPLGGKQVGQVETAPPELAAPAVADRGDGSYIVAHALPRRGTYTVDVSLDGEPIAGSPFATVAVKTAVPTVVKWLQPRVGGTAPPPFAHAAHCAHEGTLYVFGGHDGPVYSAELHALSTSRVKWEQPRTSGAAPGPRAGCASAVAGSKWLLYGGEAEVGGPPLDELWSLDLLALAWEAVPIRGVPPGRLAHAAAAVVGNRFLVFGGWTGEGCSNELSSLDTVTGIWEPVEVTSTPPTGRMMHSLTAVEDRLVLCGGRIAPDGKGVPSDEGGDFAAMWEPQSEGWTVLAPRGDVPNERWGHAAALWGGQLVVCLGTDDGGETNTISMLSLDTLSWDAWDGSGVTRSGQATALVEGKLFTVGGEEAGARGSDTMQFNLGGYTMVFDGVDDEIMVPNLPTVLPDAYTLECWVRPTVAGKAMNIVVRSDDSYPLAAWSHQLRINADGKFEHYCEASGAEGVEKYTVTHTLTAVAGNWYHVAATAAGNGDMRLYVDGSEEGTAVSVGGALRGKLDRYFIGSETGDGMGRFEGNIAEVRLWNYAQDEGEIKENMRKVTTAPDSRLAGYWRINEGPGGMIFDHSSHGNLGPIKGSPAWTASTHPVSEVGAAS